MTTRQNELLNLLLERGRLTVDELACHFDVTGMTIRRDLDVLESQGHLTRVHGGCVLRLHRVREQPFHEKERQNHAEKERIARAVVTHISHGECVYVDTGTTCSLIASLLRGMRRELNVVTNNLAAAMALLGAEGIEVIVPGGIMGSRSPDLTGDTGLKHLMQFRFDTAIVGADAIDPGTGEFYSADFATAVLSSNAQKRADRTFLCLDGSKFGRRGMAVAGVVNEDVTLFTDYTKIDRSVVSLFGAKLVIV